MTMKAKLTKCLILSHCWLFMEADYYYIENQERLEMNISWQCIENLIQTIDKYLINYLLLLTINFYCWDERLQELGHTVTAILYFLSSFERGQGQKHFWYPKFVALH